MIEPRDNDEKVTGSGPQDTEDAAPESRDPCPEAGEERGETAEAESGERESDVLVPVEEWSEVEKRAEERDLYRNELLRAKADLDNYQKRMRRERPALEERAISELLRRLLPVVDDFERALGAIDQEGATLQSVAQGVQLTYQSLLKVLADINVEEIPALGEDFNPEVHEAVIQEDVSDKRTGEVTDVLQKGYRKKDTVLRPSKVKVARNVAS